MDDSPLKQFIFGDISTAKESFSVKEGNVLISRAKDLKENGQLPSQVAIFNVFSRLAKAWSDPSYAKRREAFETLCDSSGLSREFIEVVLKEFAKMIEPEYLYKKLEGELGSIAQESFIAIREQKTRLIAQPAGVVLHVASGNVFLAGIESLINGIITRNINILKMSSNDRRFPIIFAESIKEFDTERVISSRLAILWWPGGKEGVEDVFKKNADRIIFWGGEEALLSWETGLGVSTELIRHGPKISLGVISTAGLESSNMEELTDNIALDIAIWDQKACNCPQAIFVEESVPREKIQQFTDSLAKSLEKLNRQFPPGHRSDDEYVEVMRARELAMAKGIIGKDDVAVIGPKTFEWTIISEGSSSVFEGSPLNRTILVKRYRSLDSLADSFKGQSFYLQTAGCCLATSEVTKYTAGLSSMGITRLCPFGVMAMPLPGAPHDGAYDLRDLTRFTVAEI